ncbi:MAG: hypothetical protein QXI97_01010 [Nitrososphaerota archaeon]
MRVLGYLVGGMPRPDELVRHYRDYSKGRISAETLEAMVRMSAAEIVERQNRAKLAYVCDGMLNWPDLLRPVVEGLENVEINGLARWFDNNFFYKKPVVTGPIKRVREVERKYLQADLIPRMKRKLILPDPYTLAKLSENNHYRRGEDLVLVMAEQVAEVANSLATDGYGQLQLTAPALVQSKFGREESEIAAMGLDIVSSRCPRPVMLHLPYGPATNALPAVLDFPVDVIGFDMTATIPRELYEYKVEKRIYLGLLDGRNSAMETPDEVLDTCADVADEMGVAEVHLGPSCDLELLPHGVAVKKVDLLGLILGRAGDL